MNFKEALDYVLLQIAIGLSRKHKPHPENSYFDKHIPLPDMEEN